MSVDKYGWEEILSTNGWQVYQHEDGSMAILGECGCTGWLEKNDWQMLSGERCTPHYPPKGMTMAILLYLSRIV